MEIKMWRIIAYGSRLLLLFIRGNMTAQRYVQEMVEKHVDYQRTLSNPAFEQDHARAHVTRVTIDCFERSEVNLSLWYQALPIFHQLGTSGTLWIEGCDFYLILHRGTDSLQ